MCNTINPPGKRFCGQCGLSLTEEAKMKIQDNSIELRKLFIENPKAQSIFYELLAQLKNEKINQDA